MKISFKQFALGIAGACMLTLYGCGGGDDASSTDLTGVANSVSSPSCSVYTGSSTWYDTKWSKYKNDGQCNPLIQAAESNRTSAVANCAAGDTAAATTYMSYYNKSVSSVNQFCP